MNTSFKAAGSMRNKFLCLGVMAGIFALPAAAALKVGDTAPAFTAQASFAGEPIQYSLKEELAKGPVVVYFYPSAYTRGCNVQARTFAVNQEKFAAVGASIIGVSLDSLERLNDFSADPEFCAGKFPTASDADGRIARSFDLEVREGGEGFKDTRGEDVSHGFAERTTFIVTPDGQIAATIGGVNPMDNVKKSLEFVEQLAQRAAQ